jgi:hypothetical protein
MNEIQKLIIALIFLYIPFIPAADINGRFTVNGVNNGRLEVLLQINTNTGADDMGGATIVIGFNNALNINPQVSSNYVFHNFSGGNYNSATVTKPAANKVWLNIDLPFNNNNNGTIVSGSNGWTDVASLYFDIINPSDTLKLDWLISNPYWGIYDADNLTLWNSGTFQNLSYIINTDVTPPEILSASLLDSTKLEIIFSEPMDSSTALNINNYSISSGIDILSAYLSTNLNKVYLNTTTHTQGQNYTLLVSNVRDLAGNIISPNHNSAQYSFIPDVIPPNIMGITVTSSQSITVKFSELLDPVTAKNKNNYSVSNNIVIISASLLPDSMQVKLKTTKQSAEIDYTLAVSNVKDRSGNIQSPSPRNIAYRIPRKIKGNSTKNQITNAIASTWEQNFTPDKTIDGLGMSNPASRWQSGKIMPDTITFDLNESFSMDSLRISFYKADSGRLYKYSVYSSENLNEWDTIAEDLWSEESEWSEIEFDSTSGRYLKLVLLESNQSSKTSIWEFESFGIGVTGNSDSDPLEPAEFELLQNYPNPFNPSTKIRWNSPVAGHQTLKVYDILGNEVATLVDNYRDSGYHEVIFEADNLSSGVYIYRLITDSFIQTKKMILLR